MMRGIAKDFGSSTAPLGTPPRLPGGPSPEFCQGGQGAGLGTRDNPSGAAGRICAARVPGRAGGGRGGRFAGLGALVAWRVVEGCGGVLAAVLGTLSRGIGGGAVGYCQANAGGWICAARMPGRYGGGRCWCNNHLVNTNEPIPTAGGKCVTRPAGGAPLKKWKAATLAALWKYTPGLAPGNL